MSEQIVIARPDPTALVQEFQPLVKRAGAMVVSSKDEHEVAVEAMKTLRGVEKKLTDHYEPTRKALDTAKKELLLARDKMIQPFAEARVVIGQKVDAYEAEQARIAAEERRAKEEAARKVDEERRLLEAIAAEEAGDTELAEAIVQEPVPAPVVHIEPQIAKVAGVSVRESWRAEVVDLLALIRHCAATGTTAYLQPNLVALNQQARSLRSELRIPGVRTYAEKIRAFGS